MPQEQREPMSSLPFRIGCPVWACAGWLGTLYRQSSRRESWLQQYSQVFGTVEGNSTFYGLPNDATARRWAASVQPGFEFCLKLPRMISHDLRLSSSGPQLRQFLKVAEILRTKQVLGPTFIQLPPDFSPAEKSSLETFVSRLPDEFPWAMEVRHHDWFDSAAEEKWLTDLLTAHCVDFVLFDSRPLFSRPPIDDSERRAVGRKPQTPLRTTVTAGRPFLRLICRNRLEESEAWIREWASVICDWIDQGLRPLLFTHAPDDLFAPTMAASLQQELHNRNNALPVPAEWPGSREPTRSQRSLF